MGEIVVINGIRPQYDVPKWVTYGTIDITSSRGDQSRLSSDIVGGTTSNTIRQTRGLYNGKREEEEVGGTTQPFQV